MERKQSVCHALLPAYLLSAFFIRMISNLLGAQTADCFCRQPPDLQQSLAIVRTDLFFSPTAVLLKILRQKITKDLTRMTQFRQPFRTAWIMRNSHPGSTTVFINCFTWNFNSHWYSQFELLLWSFIYPNQLNVYRSTHTGKHFRWQDKVSKANVSREI